MHVGNGAVGRTHLNICVEGHVFNFSKFESFDEAFIALFVTPYEGYVTLAELLMSMNVICIKLFPSRARHGRLPGMIGSRHLARPAMMGSADETVAI
jgi:hypothetical protein